MFSSVRLIAVLYVRVNCYFFEWQDKVTMDKHVCMNIWKVSFDNRKTLILLLKIKLWISPVKIINDIKHFLTILQFTEELHGIVTKNNHVCTTTWNSI